MMTNRTDGRLVVHSGMIWQEDSVPEGQVFATLPIARMDREPGNGTLPVERDDNAAHLVECWNAFEPDGIAQALVEVVEQAIKRLNHSAGGGRTDRSRASIRGALLAAVVPFKRED